MSALYVDLDVLYLKRADEYIFLEVFYYEKEITTEICNGRKLRLHGTDGTVKKSLYHLRGKKYSIPVFYE
jgi:ribosomal protein L35AE/L33A